MKTFMYLLMGMLITIVIYFALGTTLRMTTSAILPIVNQSGADYSMVAGNYAFIHVVFPICIVLFALATVIAYLLGAHEMEFEEYERY